MIEYPRKVEFPVMVEHRFSGLPPEPQIVRAHGVLDIPHAFAEALPKELFGDWTLVWGDPATGPYWCWGVTKRPGYGVVQLWATRGDRCLTAGK